MSSGERIPREQALAPGGVELWVSPDFKSWAILRNYQELASGECVPKDRLRACAVEAYDRLVREGMIAAPEDAVLPGMGDSTFPMEATA